MNELLLAETKDICRMHNIDFEWCREDFAFGYKFKFKKNDEHAYIIISDRDLKYKSLAVLICEVKCVVKTFIK